jgi:hypothetical protein
MKTAENVREFVLKLNSMTSTELRKEFPNTFHELSPNDDIPITVQKMLANDAIL